MTAPRDQLRRLRSPSRVRGPLVAVLLVAGAGAGCGSDGDDSQPRPVEVVRLEIPGCGLVPEIATGFGVRGGWILTNAHPLTGDGPITAAGVPLEPLAIDWRRDLAVLAAPGSEPSVPAFRGPEAGENVSVVRWRDGAAASTTGRIRSVSPIRFHDVVADSVVARDGAVVEATIVGGDSGSPVIGDDGRVVGVMFASARDEAAVSFAVSAAELDALVAETRAAPVTDVDRRTC